MMRFKYGGRAEYAGFYAEAIFRYGSHVFAGRERAKRFPFQADAILPVPIHPERYRKRGYNQAEELGRELSFRTGIPLCPDLVFRKKKTLPQKGLSGVQRRQNLSGAFAVKKGRIIPRRILLVDDIYTTGSTLNAMTEIILKTAPETEVFCVCACIAAGE